jgi:DNA-binding NarL/FixJ family response regulator
MADADPKRAAVLLHVEPDDGDGAMLASVLRDVWPGAFTVERVTGVGDALARLSAGDVDCVLLDARAVGGLAAVEQLTRAAPVLPVVVLSDHDEDDLGLRAVRAGAQDSLVKGTDAFALGRALRYAIERNRRELRLGPDG